MPKLALPFISANNLLKRWQMERYELYQAVFDYGLPVYDGRYNKIEDLYLYIHSRNRIEINEYFLSKYPDKVVSVASFSDSIYYFNFFIEDVEHFENVYDKADRKELDSNSVGLFKKMNLRFINYERLLKRWNMNGGEFRQVIYNYNLPVYKSDSYSDLKKCDEEDLKPLDNISIDLFFTTYDPHYFMIEDVLCLEEKYRMFKLTDSDKKKLRPNQLAKTKCREIAKGIWKTDPKITIADMINYSELIPHTKRKDGRLYAEKTVRNWIKDLCPDRSRGRRKGT